MAGGVVWRGGWRGPTSTLTPPPQAGREHESQQLKEAQQEVRAARARLLQLDGELEEARRERDAAQMDRALEQVSWERVCVCGWLWGYAEANGSRLWAPPGVRLALRPSAPTWRWS